MGGVENGDVGYSNCLNASDGSCWRGRPAADVGGVAGPVSGGDLLPADGGVDADAERSGEDGGGDLGGELEQRGAAGLVRADAEPIQSEFEPLGADGAAGLAAGEQPARRSGGTDGGVALALGDDGAGELVDGFGQSDWCAAEADPDVGVGDRDLVGGE